MSTLIFLEHHNGEVQKNALGVLMKASQLGLEPEGVLIGAGVRPLAEEAARFGAAKVYVAEDPRLEQPLPQPCVDVLASLAGAENVLFAQSVLAADVAAGLAARLGCGVNWDLVDLAVRDAQLVGTRPALADSLYVEVGWKGTPRLAVVRTGTFAPVANPAGTPAVEYIPVELEDFSLQGVMVEREDAEQGGPLIEDAEVIVAGGRGVGAPEHFKLVEDLAGALGAAVATTRAVVDAGWYPFATQVGQTGKTIAPKLYIALGISGAVQHKVGMQNAKVIVSINKDANAPIFEFSDLGVVGDVHTIVPELTRLINQGQSGPAGP